jgi:hypothetical protein
MDPPIGATTSHFPQMTHPSSNFPHSQTLGVDKAYSYFDSSLPTFSWTGNGKYSKYLFLALGERITMDGDSAFVDSVKVLLDRISTDSVELTLFLDTLYNVGNGRFFHLIDAFSTTAAPYAFAPIQSSEVKGPTWITVKFPHVKVPKNFFVMLSPSNNGKQFTNFYIWQTDREPARTLTADNTRSATVASDTSTGQLLSIILDGQFLATDNGMPLYTNFYTIVYASQVPAAVRTANLAALGLSIYPNPAQSGSRIAVTGAGPAASLIVSDLLGRTQFSAFGRELAVGSVQIPVSGMAAGAYQVELVDGNSRLVRPLIVVK